MSSGEPDVVRDRGPQPGEVEGSAVEEVRALLTLKCLPGVGDRTVWEIVEELGGAREALSVSDATFARIAGRSAAEKRTDREIQRTVREALERARALDVRVVGYGGPGYPGVLRQLHDPPPVLFLRGDASILESPAVAVVGSRRATVYGRRTAEAVGGALAREGVPVVSGLALGIDAAAHRGALGAGGRAIGVLGSGVDVPHPPTNSALIRRVGEEHLLVSEFMPGEPPLPHNFPRRNRILAALAEAVVVVEAAAKSGALITVDHATDLGREVLAVPGRVDSRTSQGTNALIRDGAQVVVDPFRVVELLAPDRFGRREAEEDPAGPRDPEPGGDAGRIWRALRPGPRSVDDLAGELKLDPGRLLAVLLELEVEEWVESRPGMVYARRRFGTE